MATGRNISWPEGSLDFWHGFCVFVFFLCMCVCLCVCTGLGLPEVVQRSVLQTPPAMYRHCTCHHGHNQQLAGYMILQLPRLPGKRENVSMGDEIKHFKIMHGIYMCVSVWEGGEA